MKLASTDQLAQWGNLVAKRGTAASVLQGRAFAEIKAAAGWAPSYYVADQGLPIMTLKRSIPGLGNMTYVPGGPMVESLKELDAVLDDLRELPGFVVQLEPELEAEARQLAEYAEKNSLLLRRGVQPNRSTVVVDTSPNEEEIIASLHTKTRYNVRLAERKGVKVEAVESAPQNMSTMYKLMHSSQDRGGYYLRPQSYFEAAWQTYTKYNEGQLFFARYEDKVLAGAFITYVGQKALYKDGGSIRDHREVQPMSLLQWEIMRWLKRRGVTHYDLDGVPPLGQIDDPSHPFAGLARFKMGFSPTVTTYAGMIEIVRQPGAYKIWRGGAERIFGTALYRLKGQSIY